MLPSRYTALLAVTILCLSSTVGVSGKCRTDISPKSGLEDTYFSGTWYVTHYLDKDPQVSDPYCSSFAPTKDGNVVKEALYHYNTKTLKSFYNIGTGSLQSSGAQYNATYNTVDDKRNELKPTNPKNSYTLTVMEADDKSALVHICLRKGDKDLGDLYTVLNRKKGADPKDKFKGALSTVGLQLNEFVVTQALGGCQYDDDFTSLK